MSLPHISHVWLCHALFYSNCDIWEILLFYGVASSSRLLKIIGLFCKRDLYKRLYYAKETYTFKEPTNRCHPIARCIRQEGKHNATPLPRQEDKYNATPPPHTATHPPMLQHHSLTLQQCTVTTQDAHQLLETRGPLGVSTVVCDIYIEFVTHIWSGATLRETPPATRIRACCSHVSVAWWCHLQDEMTHDSFIYEIAHSCMT